MMSTNLWQRMRDTRGAAANGLIRLVVGGVFLNEGVLKFLDPAANAAGRFAAIGLPRPEILGPFVAAVETVGGALVILGLVNRVAALALFIDISAAIFTTKVPVLLGHAYLGLSLMKLKSYGLLSMVHEARTDFAMWFGLLFLLMAGPGRWSLDAWRRGGTNAA
jgi:putative oxidoreductase